MATRPVTLARRPNGWNAGARPRDRPPLRSGDRACGPSADSEVHTLSRLDRHVSEEVAASDRRRRDVDVWQVMHDQGREPTAGTRFLESWEVPS